jgi:hypothetical protein
LQSRARAGLRPCCCTDAVHDVVVLEETAYYRQTNPTEEAGTPTSEPL